MDTELIAAINRLAAAHERLADNVGRVADALKFTEFKPTDQTFADALVEQVRSIAGSIDQVAEKLPELPES